MIDTIRQVFNDMPPLVQIGLMALVAATVFSLLIHGLAAAGLREARDLIASLESKKSFTVTDEFKGESFAWISCGIWMGLFLNAVVSGEIGPLLGGFVVWTAVTVIGLTVWALRQGSK